MDKFLYNNLKEGDKIVVVNKARLSWETSNPKRLELAEKEVTFERFSGGDIIIKEDNGASYWNTALFKNIVNGVNYDAIEPKFSTKNSFKIEFDPMDNKYDRFLRYFNLSKITNNLDLLTKFNSERFSRVIKGKWVVISKASGRIYSKYNPHLMMEENHIKDYKLDNVDQLVVESKQMFDENDLFKALTINFKSGKFKVNKFKGGVCQCCGRPMNPHTSFGKFCYDCVVHRKELTVRFGYHDYEEGYPTPPKVDTTKVPVFGCEIERDWEDCHDYDYDEDDDDEYYDEDDRRYENFSDDLSSATLDIVKIMQGDQFEKGILKRENVFMCDGSLNNDGLEWITFPHTFEWYVKNKDKFDSALKRIDNYGFCNTPSVGNHIHINRDFFTIDGKDYSDFCASKIAILFSKYWEAFKAIAKRHNDGYTGKPSVQLDKCPATQLYDLMCCKREHSVAVNLQHNNSVEIRLWSGIDNADDLIFYLDNMQALARYAKKVSIERVQVAKFTDFMKYYKLDTSAKMALDRVKAWRNFIEPSTIKDLEEFVERKENNQ